MTDLAELKALAEAATPGPWSYDGSYVCPARVEAGTTYVETWRSVADCHQPENTQFIAAANPAVVLELIAENERLREAHEQVCTNYNQVSFASEERGKQIAELKAECEGLRADAEKWKIVESAMAQLQSDEQEASIWSACSRILISVAHKLNSGTSTVTEEGVTVGDEEIGDWCVTVSRIKPAIGKEASNG